MVVIVNEAFYQLEPKTLSNVWMSLQHVMVEILKAKGGNDFDLPHVNKRRMEALGTLDAQVKAPMGPVMDAWNIIHDIVQATDATT